jgi:predicted nucleotidyltransferase
MAESAGESKGLGQGQDAVIEYEAMLPLIEAHRDEIAELCRRFHIRRLEVFGSAAREADFDPDRSDIDFLVTYEPDGPPRTVGTYFKLQEQLEALFARPVDLVASGSVRNPFIRAAIERSRQRVYGT